MGARLVHSRGSQNTVLPPLSQKEGFLGPSMEEMVEGPYKKAEETGGRTALEPWVQILALSATPCMTLSKSLTSLSLSSSSI